ncbi:hypothetical protein CBER1_11498 [Cercospora berteroae]|uniref:Uncharacterized protein n=1 Tax=Cercospora berteroae TaxID=357750 RepID=A0A2S6BZX3_9PEZI|nr:hypothetical protein CBER1_11498 [Cercospora berteroae]
MESALKHHALGGTPSPKPDVGINITFLILFTICGVVHFETFWRNKKQERLFAFNAATTIFCFTRVFATSLRVGWAYDPTNVSLAASSHAFVFLGTIILIICNLWWSQRILRAQHPHFGWTVVPTFAIPIIVGLSIFTISLLITSTCLDFYTDAEGAQDAALGIRQYGAVLFAMFAFLPLPILLASALAKTHPDLRDSAEDNFGRHSIIRKILVCLTTAALLFTGTLFRAVTSFAPQTGVEMPAPWYFSKACFYIFNFTLEILVVIFWMIIRVDKLFIIPNGAWGPQSYGEGFISYSESGHQQPAMTHYRHERLAQPHHGFDIQSTRSSTIPPPSRMGSWGSARRYMCRSPSLRTSPRMDQTSTWDSVSQTWAGTSHTRVDSAWGGDSRSGVAHTNTNTKESLDLSRPPCVRCANCGNHEDISSFNGIAYKQMPEMGFDPRTGRWVRRQMSLSGPSVSQYSVRETLRPQSTIDSRMSEDASPGSFLERWQR